MIAFSILLLIQTTTNPPLCSRDAIEQRHLEVLKPIRSNANKLLEERRSILLRRSEIAKRSIRLAEMSAMKRDFKETFGESQEDLERLDMAYTARLNTISDEGGMIKNDLDAERARYSGDLIRCGIN